MVNKDYQIILTNVVTHLFFDALDDLSGGSDVTVAWHTTGYVHDANDQPTNQSINQWCGCCWWWRQWRWARRETSLHGGGGTGFWVSECDGRRYLARRACWPRSRQHPTPLRHFVHLLWVPKGRFVYWTRENGDVGGTNVCGAATAHSSLAGISPGLIWRKCRIHALRHFLTTKRKLIATLFMRNF